MWAKISTGQDGRRLVNLDMFEYVDLCITGNVGRIFAFNESEEVLLGEYRDYAAKRVFEQISMFIGQKDPFFMPDEDYANEKYKDDDCQNATLEKGCETK